MNARVLGFFVVAFLLGAGLVLWLIPRPDRADSERPAMEVTEEMDASTDSTDQTPEEEAVAESDSEEVAPAGKTIESSTPVQVKGHALQRFADWMKEPEPTDSSEQERWLEEGVVLARERGETMRRLIREEPEAALAVAISPRQFARLPEAVQAETERPIAEEGFYGVLASCRHGPGEEHLSSCEISQEVTLDFGTFDAEVLDASIYGTRELRMTEENASLFGVAMDGVIALHEDDVVIVDDGEGFDGPRYAVYYKGEALLTEDFEEANSFKRENTQDWHRPF